MKEYHWHVFDVLEDDFGFPEIENSIHHPKEFKDICQEMFDIMPDEMKNGNVEWHDTSERLNLFFPKRTPVQGVARL